MRPAVWQNGWWKNPTQLGTQSGQLARKVELTADSGNMTDTNLNEFYRSFQHILNIWVNIPISVTIGLVLDNQSRAFTGYLYAPPPGEAARALRSCAAGRTRMGAVFIEYGGETYVVALFA